MARIREVQAAEWDAVLAGFAQATPFDTAAYKTAYAACMGQPVPRYFTCTEKGVVLCALAHFSAKGKGVHPKYTPYQTLLLQPSALIKPTGHFSTAGGVAVGQLLAHAHNALGTLAYTLPDAQTDLRPFATSTAAQPIALKDRYTIVNALAPLAEAEKQAQKEIRQGMERGFVCLPLHDVPAFCSLHRETALRKGFYDAATLPGLEALVAQLFTAGVVELWQCGRAGAVEAVQAMLLAPDGRTAYAWLAGSTPTAEPDGVNMVFTAQLLQAYAAKGCERYDFCGANLPAVARFKAQFGGNLVRFWQVRDGVPGHGAGWMRIVKKAISWPFRKK